MKTLIVEMKDSAYPNIINYLKQYPDVKYYNYENDVYTKNDLKQFIQSVKELQQDEAIDIDDYMKERGIVN